MTQSFIVYRNPIEAAFWESVSSGQIFPIICGIIVFFVVFLILNAFVVEKYTRWNSQARSYGAYTALAVGAIAGCLTVFKM